MSGWTVRADGIVLSVRVTPRAAREDFGRGRDGEGFAARVSAPPVDGAANDAIIRLVARSFDVARRDVTILSGETARTKRVAVSGDPAALEQVARRLYGDAP